MGKTLLMTIVFLSFFGQIQSQNSSYWNEVKLGKSELLARKNKARNTEKYFTLDAVVLKQKLNNLSGKSVKLTPAEVGIPNLKGGLDMYLVTENSNLDPVLQAKYPDIRSYVGQGKTDKNARVHFSLSALGLQTVVFRADNQMEFVEMYDNQNSTYVVFDSNKDSAARQGYQCTTPDTKVVSHKTSITGKSTASNKSYKTLRLALSCNGEYAAHFGGTVALALAGMNASLTRINAIFERDFAAHMNLIANNDQLIYLDAATDPFSNGDVGTKNEVWNTEVQNMLSTRIGNGAYDVGHVFCKTGGGGNAGCIGCVCTDDDVTNLTDLNKGSGYTSPESESAAPSGDVFDFDFAAHEFGHQFGANHTFSYEFEGSVVQVEPGSGCTTMGYAGVTSWDVQPHNMRNFAYVSIKQVQENLATKTCPVSVTTTNSAPVVDAGADFTIPKGTAFVLTGTATDADATDVLTYSWEQNDVSTAATIGDLSRTLDTKLVGPTFRIQEPSSSPVRYMPQLASVILGQLTTPTNWESVSNVTRDLNFAFTARDNRATEGQTNSDLMKVSVVTTAGPFVVTSQNTSAITYTGGTTQTITWDVNNTATLDGSANVTILLSTDGGKTFTTTVAASVPNNGTAAVVIPNIASTTCRLMIKPIANIYYAVNATDFAITTSLATVKFGLESFGIYPTFNDGNFTISFSSDEDSDVKVLVNDALGKKIYANTYKKNATNFNQPIQVKNVQSGIYFVTVENGNKKEVKRIIVK